MNVVDEPTLVAYSVSFWRHTADPQLTIMFVPEGLVFNAPIEVTVKMNNTDFKAGDQVVMYYFNESTTIWEPVDSFTIDDDYDSSYSLSIEHFSLYAFTRIRNGDE